MNVEADDLTNLRFDRFTLSKRCQLDWKILDWSMMEKFPRGPRLERGKGQDPSTSGPARGRSWRPRQSGDSAIVQHVSG